jgi:hypothetical protein
MLFVRRWKIFEILLAAFLMAAPGWLPEPVAFAIILDSEVISGPVIREPITGGSGQISGSFTVEEAAKLAIFLRSGAPPTIPNSR